MLQSMGSQRVRHDSATEGQQLIIWDPLFKCQKNFQDPFIMLVTLWLTSWVTPSATCASFNHREPQAHFWQWPRKPKALQHTYCPLPPTPHFQNLSSSWLCLFWDTCLLSKFRAPFQEELERKNPYRHLSSFSDCFLLNACWVSEHWLSVCIIFYYSCDTSRFSKLFAPYLSIIHLYMELC